MSEEEMQVVDPETLHCHVAPEGDPGVPRCQGETYCSCSCNGCLRAHQIAALWYARRLQRELSRRPPEPMVLASGLGQLFEAVCALPPRCHLRVGQERDDNDKLVYTAVITEAPPEGGWEYRGHYYHDHPSDKFTEPLPMHQRFEPVPRCGITAYEPEAAARLTLAMVWGWPAHHTAWLERLPPHLRRFMEE